MEIYTNRVHIFQEPNLHIIIILASLVQFETWSRVLEYFILVYKAASIPQ